MPDAAPDQGAAPPLTPERWQRARAAFDAAVGRGPATRAAVLDAVDDAALRAMVERMLADDEGASLRLGPPLVAFSPADDADDGDDALPSVAGRRVGPYRVEREIGRGGMGTVYLAERDDVGRRVALKLVRGGLAAPERVARFLLERRVLARLDHPGIARLLDAGVMDGGTVDDGTPWFAMEYVDGAPIDRYCDAHRLPIPDRLRLVEQVCEAVAYAHRNLVVHRDLKPSNILVTAPTPAEAGGEAKLLDFGIAKLLADAADGADAGLTEAGGRLLTPEYAAPEQVRGDPVTTATDVYALGVVLYELLTGSRPYEALAGAPSAIGGVITDPRRRPTRPSSAVAADRSDRPAAAIAAARSSTVERLRHQLAGDLDTIVLKALDPDPERRYASAAALLDDLRRHRTGFPVRARPDRRLYRAGAFVRRNRWSVAAAAALFALLAATAVVTTVQQARTARALARATAEATKSRQVARFVTSLIENADPYRVGATRATLPSQGPDELVDLGAEQLERDLAQQPAVRAELLHTLGIVARSLGRYETADTLLRRGLALHRQLRGASAPPDAETAGLLHDLGVVSNLRSDLPAADTLLGQALAIRTRLPGDHGAELDATRYELASAYRLQARFVEAEQLLRQVIADRRATPGPALADALQQLGSTRYDVHDFAGAERLARETIAIRERSLGAEHPAVAVAYQHLGKALNALYRADDAERAVRWALEIQHRRLPAGHPDVFNTESELSWILLLKGKAAEAERIQRRLLDARRRMNGEFSRDAAGSYLTLGSILHDRRDFAGAEDALEHAVASYTRAFDPEHPMVRRALGTIAVVQTLRGHEAAALATMARLRVLRHDAVWDAASPGDDAQLLASLAAQLLEEDDDCAHARPLARRALAAYMARHPNAPADDAHLVQLRAGVAACPHHKP